MRSTDLSEEELAYPVAATLVVRRTPDGELMISLQGERVHPAHLADSLLTVAQDLIRTAFAHDVLGKCDHDAEQEGDGHGR